MKVREFIEWLAAFEDQDADVEALNCFEGDGFGPSDCDVWPVLFNPREHAEYIDMRWKPDIKPNNPSYNTRTLRLGQWNE